MSNYIPINDAEHIESIKVHLTKEKTPIAFQNKLKELLEQNAFDSVVEATQWIENTPFELELYYEKNYGLFAVEADAIENGASIVSPYSLTELA